MNTTTSKLDVYARKAIITRKRRALVDARLTAQFAARRAELAAKLDAIFAASKTKVGGNA